MLCEITDYLDLFSRLLIVGNPLGTKRQTCLIYLDNYETNKNKLTKLELTGKTELIRSNIQRLSELYAFAAMWNCNFR